MIPAPLVLLPLAFTGRFISWGEGLLLFGIYVAHVGYLVLSTAHHDRLEPFSAAMLWFVVPLTTMWLLNLVGHELGLRRPRMKDDGQPLDYLNSPLTRPTPTATQSRDE